MKKRGYWKSAALELKSLKKLMFAALICALSIVIGGFYITVGENLRVYFTFFLTAVGCSVYGPVVGMLAAVVTDTLNFLIFPTGPYFPGYMLGEMLAAVIYSLFLYRRKITVLGLFSAKLLVNYIVNVALGSLWSKILYGQGYLYYLVKSLVKNTLLLPFEVVALAALMGLLIPVFARFGLLPVHEKKDLRKLALSSSAFSAFGLSFLLGGLCSLYYGRTYTEGLVFPILGICLCLLGIGLLIAGRIYLKKQQRNEE